MGKAALIVRRALGQAEGYSTARGIEDVPLIYDTFYSNTWLFSFVIYQTFGVGNRPGILVSKQLPLNTSGDP